MIKILNHWLDSYLFDHYLKDVYRYHFEEKCNIFNSFNYFLTTRLSKYLI